MNIEQSIIDNTYKIIGEIGSGGGGVVYKAYHLRLEKYVVIKKIKDSVKGKIDLRGEADILKRLSHKYLPHVYDYITVDEDVYTVIDFVEGKSFDKLLSEGINFSDAQVVKWATQLAEAMAYLHGQKPMIIHSDIKPANLMLNDKDDICLIDFNISFSGDGFGQAIGKSDGYSPEEQYIRKSSNVILSEVTDISTPSAKHSMGVSEGSKSSRNYYKQIDLRIDQRSDIYSFGATMYHLYTGKKPEISTKTVTPVEQLKPQISDGLRYILNKAMAKSPDDRFQSADEVLKSLQNIHKLDDKHRHFVRKQWLKLGVISLCLTGFISLSVLGVLQLRVEKQEKYESIIESAEIFFDEAAYESVFEAASTAISVFEEQPDGYFWYARALYETRQFDEGIDYLSNVVYKTFKPVGSKGQQYQADIQYLMGNFLFEKEEYHEALNFFEQAIDRNPNNPEYYRDYAIALARLGEMDEAEATVQIAKTLGLEGASLSLVQGELSFKRLKYDVAALAFEEAFEQSDQDHLKSRAAIQCAQSYGMLNQSTNQIRILEQALIELPSSQQVMLLDMLGGVYTKYGRDTNQVDYFQMAIMNFEKLIRMGYAPYYIHHNIALCYQYMGNFEKAERKLLDNAEQFKDQYLPHMQLAFLYAEFEAQKNQSDRNYQHVYLSYLEAQSRYELSRQEDTQMVMLKNLMDDLVRNGWIVK